MSRQVPQWSLHSNQGRAALSRYNPARSSHKTVRKIILHVDFTFGVKPYNFTPLLNLVTLVESAGGFWASQAITTSSGPSAEDGTYLSCAFDANGGPNASCLLLEYFPSTTVTQTFAASKDPLAIVPTAATPTTSSNAAIARFGGSYGWKSGLYTLFLCVSALILAI